MVDFDEFSNFCVFDIKRYFCANCSVIEKNELGYVWYCCGWLLFNRVVSLNESTEFNRAFGGFFCHKNRVFFLFCHRVTNYHMVSNRLPCVKFRKILFFQNFKNSYLSNRKSVSAAVRSDRKLEECSMLWKWKYWFLVPNSLIRENWMNMRYYA